MPIVLFRVDERLIHGQVVVGWGGPLHADRIVVADDAIAESPWEQELYCLGVPPEIEASFLHVDEARARISGWRDDPGHRTIVLVRDVDTLRRVSDGQALRGEEVNLGGIHHAAGREKMLPYLFLTPQEGQTLRELAGQGVRISARDLPATRPVPLDDLLQAGR
jgi:PTS system mannose-specific IIB component/fructoselysine and glucoselysine-specific PTS system IIB component